MSYVAQIDRGACSAHGDCVDIAPGIFELDETAVVVGEGPDELVLKAAEACPALAITVIDSETGETVHP
jgi:ferredoxin